MPVGIYLHIPFCLSKCPYCDFYSVALPEESVLDAYTQRLMQEMDAFRGQKADTLYFGGGTPSLLGARRICALIEKAAECFGLFNAEITLEANPGDPLSDTLRAFSLTGGNRLSVGMQCGDCNGLQLLGRRHTPQDFLRCVEQARHAGIQNVSADWMLALPHETDIARQSSLELLKQAQVQHISAYLLKTEPNTPFYRDRDRLALPSDEQAADQYLHAVSLLQQNGFAQYEISNFCLPGFESRHNLKYWNAQPYLGFGAAAHSFFDGKRFAYARDLNAFLRGDAPQPLPQHPDIPDGSAAEYLMLRLRLTKGITEHAFSERFGAPLPTEWRTRAAKIPSSLLQADNNGLRLTPQGMLLSNEILRRLLDL